MPVSSRSSEKINASDVIIGESSGQSYVVNGDDDFVLMGDDDRLLAHGSGFVIVALGSDDLVIVGRPETSTTGGIVDVVDFGVPGALRELANSSVVVNASGSKLSLAGDDALSVFGSKNRIFAGGVGDTVLIGENDAEADIATRDSVRGLESGSLFLLANSAVLATGDDFVASLAGNDKLAAFGSSIQVNALGDGNSVTIGGNTIGKDDVVHMNDGAVRIVPNSSVDVFGDNLSVRASDGDAVFANRLG